MVALAVTSLIGRRPLYKFQRYCPEPLGIGASMGTGIFQWLARAGGLPPTRHHQPPTSVLELFLFDRLRRVEKVHVTACEKGHCYLYLYSHTSYFHGSIPQVPKGST